MSINKVLFFKPGAIGDLLHTLPALAALKRKFPAAQVTVVVSPGLESLLQGTSIADRVLVFDKAKYNNRLQGTIEFGSQLRHEQYDLFIDMQPSLRSLVLRRFSGAGTTLVYRKLNKNADKSRIHAVDNFMATLKPLGIEEPVEEIRLPVDPKALVAVERFLVENGVERGKPLVALNCSVGAARPARNWFPERFAQLADLLRDKLNASVIFVGGNEDCELVQLVMNEMRGASFSAAGRLSLDQSAALLSKCNCLVSSDTGPLHLATAVGTPVVGLFGSTDPGRTGPIGKNTQVIIKALDCIPCEEKQCPLGTRACMAAITVNEVFEATRKAVA